MKRNIVVFVSALMTVLTAVVAAGAVYSGLVGEEETYSPGEITEYAGALDVSSGVQGDTLTFTLSDGAAQINAVELSEKTSAVTSFEIYTDSGDMIYASDFIDGFRYCSFPAVTAGALKLKVTNSDGAFEIASFKPLRVYPRDTSDFSVMAYVTADSACRMGEEWRENAETVTRFNLIGNLFFDIEGNLLFDTYDGADDIPGTGEAIFELALKNLRALNPDAEIVATILGNRDLTGDGITDTQERHNHAMGIRNRANFAKNIVSFVEKYELDGIAFDYEYPSSVLSFSYYSRFITLLRENMPDKLITAAHSEWNMGIGRVGESTLDKLDAIELMSYDLFDSRGNHSTFYTAYSNIQGAVDKGADREKIDLGLPFYSRPINGDAYWGTYANIADKLEYRENTLTESYTTDDGVSNTLPNYYNGRQLIYDKTCYALDIGIGGVMIWHFACDSTDPEYSLTQTIARAIASRSI